MNLLFGTGMVQTMGMMTASKEVDFSIKYLTDFYVFGQKLSITTTHISIIIITSALIIFALLANRCIKKAEEIPGYFQNALEMIVDMLTNMVEGIMGKNAKGFVNYISTIFIFILISNISGIFGLRPPTADYGTTLSLGLITFFMIHYYGFKNQKFGHITALFDPPILAPINIIGEIAVPISLSLRLFGNLLSGTVFTSLIYGLTPIFIQFGIPSVLHVYFDLFSGAIQAYVFCMLTMVYINNQFSD